MTQSIMKPCWFFHDWYYGSYQSPVYGRYERHCLACGQTEKMVRGSWTRFDRMEEDQDFRIRQHYEKPNA